MEDLLSVNKNMNEPIQEKDIIRNEDGDEVEQVSKQKLYRILWDRNDYGKLVILASDEAEAREKFESGDYNEDELEIKNGGIDLVSIEEV